MLQKYTKKTKYRCSKHIKHPATRPFLTHLTNLHSNFNNPTIKQTVHPGGITRYSCLFHKRPVISRSYDFVCRTRVRIDKCFWQVTLCLAVPFKFKSSQNAILFLD